MKIQRTLTVFLCAAGAALLLAILKALLISGMDTLPPVKLLIFAASTFGLLAALIDWSLFQNARRSEDAVANIPPPPVPQTDPAIAQARLRPIVFREICPPPAAPGLSFYGGVPVGPAKLAWPRNKTGDVPLSFIMQWDCTELAGQDVTELLPRDGVLYFFADLEWSDFKFVHAPGPAADWQAVPVPSELPPLYGKDGAYQVPYCSPLIAPETQDVPRLLPKWPFTPISFSFPASPDDPDSAGLFWNESDPVAEALLQLQYPDGVPPAKHLNKRHAPFARPFAAFPHDYAAIRVVTAKVLDELRRPGNRILRDANEQEREATFQLWRNEAIERYALATAHHPSARVEQSLSDDMWRWMEGLEPLLRLGWGSLVEECVNVSLGLRTKAAGALPPELVAVCADRHRIASAYLHEEYADRSKPDALAAWEKRKAEGSLKEVRSLHAPCPNHMFGPPSYVQGYVEEHLEQYLLLLELSSRESIGLELGEGVLQFMIRPSDLREGRFDKAVLIASAY